MKNKKTNTQERLRAATYIRFTDQETEDMAEVFCTSREDMFNSANSSWSITRPEDVYADSYCFGLLHPSHLPELNRLISKIRAEEIDTVFLFKVELGVPAKMMLVVDFPTKRNLAHKGMKYFVDPKRPDLAEKLIKLQNWEENDFDQDVVGKQQRALFETFDNKYISDEGF